jgi:membrane protein implicated in regulation of membrane protease activity
MAGRGFQRIYRLLLLAYPAEFRRRFGTEMLELIASSDRLSRTELLVDLVTSAARERWAAAHEHASLPRLCTGLLTAALSASLLVMSHRHLLGLLPAQHPALPNLLGTVLPALNDPTVAFVLVVAGLYGLITELSAPGAWLPGSLGVASMAAGLLSLAAMPVNRLGLALLLGSVAVFLAGVKLPIHGLLTDAGVLLFITGSLTLFNFGDSGLTISEPVVLAASAVTACFFGAVARFGATARKLPPTLGPSELLGRVGQARTALNAGGQVFVRGERWAAICDEPVPAGVPVQVVGISGLTLTVRRMGM